MIMAKSDQEKNNVSKALSELSSIVEWFEKQEEIDVEEGLSKVKEGAKLIKIARARLKEIDNEFREVQKDIESAVDDR
jgi:exonuclease VII small subunit